MPLDPETFTHGMPSIEAFARLDNQEAERSLNMIHTTSSMLSAKEALAALPANAGDDFHYDDDSDEDLNEALGNSLGEEPAVSLPSWLSIQSANATVVSLELQRQATSLLHPQAGSSSSSPFISATLASQAMETSDFTSINLFTFRKRLNISTLSSLLLKLIYPNRLMRSFLHKSICNVCH